MDVAIVSGGGGSGVGEGGDGGGDKVEIVDMASQRGIMAPNGVLQASWTRSAAFWPSGREISARNSGAAVVSVAMLASVRRRGRVYIVAGLKWSFW